MHNQDVLVRLNWRNNIHIVIKPKPSDFIIFRRTWKLTQLSFVKLEGWHWWLLKDRGLIYEYITRKEHKYDQKKKSWANRLYTKTSKPSRWRGQPSSSREIVVWSNMQMQLFPILLCNFDTIFLVLNITGTTANFPKTILVPVSREGNLLQ